MVYTFVTTASHNNGADISVRALVAKFERLALSTWPTGQSGEVVGKSCLCRTFR